MGAKKAIKRRIRGLLLYVSVDEMRGIKEGIVLKYRPLAMTTQVARKDLRKTLPLELHYCCTSLRKIIQFSTANAYQNHA